jgi:hypothetical protein
MTIPDHDMLDISYMNLCDRIETLTTRMMDFWISADGWAPLEAAGLLSRSMLGWQTNGTS